MRKLTAGLFMSVDGVVESPNLWQFDRFDEELGNEMTGMFARVDAAILGRVGYSDWSQYWPNAGINDPFAAFVNPLKKYVASRTLSPDLSWENSELIQGDLVEFVRKLKATDGGDIAVIGGISIVRELLFSGELDELSLMMHPVVAGAGRHMFEPTDAVTRLELIEAPTTSKGNVLLKYRLRAE